MYIINSKIQECDSQVPSAHPTLRDVLMVLLTVIEDVRPRVQEESEMFQNFGEAGGVASLINTISSRSGNVETITVCMQLLSVMLDNLRIACRYTYDDDGNTLYRYVEDCQTGVANYDTDSDDSSNWPLYEPERNDASQIELSTAQRNTIIALTLNSLERFPTNTMLYEKSLEMLKNLFQVDTAECYNEFYEQGAIPKIVRCLSARHANLHAHGLFAFFVCVIIRDYEDSPMPPRNIAIMLQLVTSGAISIFLDTIVQQFEHPPESCDVKRIFQLLELIIAYGYGQHVTDAGGDTVMTRYYEQQNELAMRMSLRRFAIAEVRHMCTSR